MAAVVTRLAAALALLAVLGAGRAAAWRAGSGSRTILPTVNGTTDYFVPLPDEDATSAGTLVLEWDVGRISVGNGDTRSHWVRDELRTYAAAVESDDGTILIFSTTEVYMLFEPDLEVYYDRVRAAVAPEVAARLRFFAHGQHNHEGPDTSGLGGPVNRKYIEYMHSQMTAATLDAIRSLEPATLRYGTFKHLFGVADSRDPLIVDPDVKVLRALPASNPNAPPIFTVVQWAMHPEVTLGYRPTFPTSDCVELGRDPNDPNECNARGQFFTADYPGALRRVLQATDGSKEVLYFNGAIGSQIGPGGVVWEVTEEHPLGDGATLPPGAVALPYNFRKAFLIGQQLALQVAKFSAPYTVPSGSIEWRETAQYSRLTNILFKIGLVPASALGGDPTKPLVLGYALRQLFLCSEPASDATCVDDGFDFEYRPLPVRVGNFAKIRLFYAKLGPLQFVTLPGEFSPELAIGVPTDFDTAEGVKYFTRPDLHPIGADYSFPGTVYEMLNCTATENTCFTMGLTVDEMGYVLPIADWRLACLGTDEECLDDYNKGALTYFDSMSGEACEAIVRDIPAAEQRYTEQYGAATAERVINACKFGQTSQAAESGEHYEETNSGGWNGANDYFSALSNLLGVAPRGRYQYI